jgi:disulfide bond formation protein DsbB
MNRFSALFGHQPVRAAALSASLIAALILALAYVFQYGFGYEPCPLCLKQRWPYYLGIPLGLLIGLLAPSLPRLVSALALVCLAAIFAYGLYLGVYQAGAEWAFWPGPADCAAGNTGETPAGVGGLLGAIATSKVVSCTDPSFRFLGLSFAGWNAVVMAALTTLALTGAALAARQGSSSVSQ